MNIEEHLGRLGGFSPDDIRAIREYFNNIPLAKGQYFARQKRYCDKLAFVESGYLRVFIEVHDREVTQWISSPGYFVTDLSSFIFQTDGRWNIQALTDCALRVITKPQHEALCETLPAWRNVYNLFVAKCFTMLEDRIFNHLHMDTEERFHHLMQTQPELFNAVPLHYLASMLGMTPETLSRLRKKQWERDS